MADDKIGDLAYQYGAVDRDIGERAICFKFPATVDGMGGAWAFCAAVDRTLFTIDDPIKNRGMVEVWVFDHARVQPCSVCGNDMFCDLSTKKWSHPKRMAWRPIEHITSSDYCTDVYRVKLIRLALECYYRIPEGYTFQEGVDHGIIEHDLAPCEFCQRRRLGCPSSADPAVT